MRSPLPDRILREHIPGESSVPAGFRPEGPSSLLELLMRALDEVDYGLMLFRPDLQLWSNNHLARVLLGRGDPLYLEEGRLKVRLSTHQAALQVAMQRASQGVRSLLSFTGHTSGSMQALAVVPMAHPAEWPGQTVPVLLITGRPTLCEALSLRFFAQAHQLTRTEEAVLADLVQGQELEEIAQQRGMAISTARSHVKQLRLKTGSSSMRELLNKVAMLPPVVSAMRVMGP